MWGNIVNAFLKILEGDHHGVSDMSEVCVIFHFFRKYVARIYDSRDVFDIHIFWLMTFANHILSEVEVLDSFEVTEAAHWTAALFSLYILVISYASVMLVSLKQWFRDWSLVLHSLVAMI